MTIDQFLQLFTECNLRYLERGPAHDRKRVWCVTPFAGYFTTDTDRLSCACSPDGFPGAYGFGDTPEQACEDYARKRLGELQARAADMRERLGSWEGAVRDFEIKLGLR